VEEHFWKPYIRQAVGGELDLMVLISGAEELAAIQWEKSMLSQQLQIHSEDGNCNVCRNVG
jgi:hypothetical protein